MSGRTTITNPTISYVILCHRNAPQVLRLARTIRALSARARVLIRHDQPPGFIDGSAAEACGADLLVSQTRCRWGDWSLVEASLEAFRHACELHHPDWIVLISGDDYPIRPLEPWEKTLLSGAEDAVLTGEPLVDGPAGLRPGSSRERLQMRYTHRWYRLPRLNVVSRLPSSVTRSIRSVWFKYVYPLQAIVVLQLLPREEGWALGIRRRAVPWSSDTPVYKGSQWVALSRRAAEMSIGGSQARRMQEYFARTLVPDEAYFQTLLANASAIRVRPEPVCWVRWESEASPHPARIDVRDLEAVARSSAPFARKFDDAVTPGILDRIDQTLLFEHVS
jgi:hypothetical protein